MRITITIAALLLLSACKTTNNIPRQLNDGIAVTAAEVQKVDSSKLRKGAFQVYEIQEGSVAPSINRQKDYTNINSMLIARNGKLIFERYFNGASHSKPQHMASLGKSVVSAVFGVAVDKNLIHSSEDSLYRYFNYPDIQNWNEDKQAIKLKHLLSMAAGWQCGSISDYKNHCGHQMLQQQDPYKWVLDLPMAAPPGNKFNYNDAVPIFVKAIISVAAQQSATEFYRKTLMEPLEITNNVLLTSKMTSREMLKFGLLFINDGKWNGQQLISPEWIKESTANQYKFKTDSQTKGYGYLWWNYEFESDNKKYQSYYAGGNGGQFIFIIPELDLVAVFTGSNYGRMNHMRQPFEIMEKYVLPSIQG